MTVDKSASVTLKCSRTNVIILLLSGDEAEPTDSKQQALRAFSGEAAPARDAAQNKPKSSFASLMDRYSSTAQEANSARPALAAMQPRASTRPVNPFAK